MEYKYKVTFAHEDEEQQDESIRHGWGTADIETDMPVETDEQMLEVARSIGQSQGFTKVGIIKIEELE